jgi:hypothetical protein
MWAMIAVKEAVRPVGQRFRPDPDVDEVVDLEKRLDVGPQLGGLHHHRVAAGEEHVGHLAVSTNVLGQKIGLLRSELELFHAHELRPAETVGAVGMTRLPLTGEVQNGLAVLVLHSR